MRTFSFIFTAFFAVLLIFNSCTIEKKRYGTGFYMGWKDPKTKKKENRGHIKHPEINTKTENLTLEREEIQTQNTGPEKILFTTTDNSLFAISTEILRESNKPVVSEDEAFNLTQKEQKQPQKKLKPKKLSEGKTLHWGAIFGFLLSIIGLFAFAVILCPLAIIFSILALVAIEKNPEKYSGAGLAIAGLIIGVIGFVGYLIFLALVL